jgi:ribA/ribD-fused uncharacterized protein
METLDIIDDFHGVYRYLSNFWEHPVEFQGVIYPSNEHAFVAAKTTDQTIREVIREAKTPGQVKRMGRNLVLRPDWENIKVMVMLDLCKTKFAPGTALASKLLATGDAFLIEGNTWGDRVWGTVNGEGCNYLGKILMKVRAELRGERFDIY